MPRRTHRRLAAALLPALALGVTACGPTTPPSGPEPGMVAGAQAVGTTAYGVPAGAVFVSPLGRDGATGAESDPHRTLRGAVSAAPLGATLVLRGGTYREVVEIPATKRLTLQPYPGEEARMSGSDVVTGWVSDGDDWRRDGWTARFDHTGLNSTLIDAAHPLAGYPDMAFIDGRALRQVGSRSAVVPGTFWVDEYASRLFIGDDPTDRVVEGTVRPEGLNVKASGTVIRGLGFEHYGTHISRHGAVKASGSDVVFENNEFNDNAAAGLSVTGPGIVIRRNTFKANGQVGLHADTATRVLFESNWVTDNNVERFYPAAAAGGVKLTETTDAVMRANIVDDNWGHGLWFDLSSDRATIVGNITRRNALAAGIFFEYSTGAIIAGNVSTDNEAGIQAGESSQVQVWNNTVVNNIYSFKAYDGWREPVPVGITLRNNVFSARGLSTRPVLINEDAAAVRSWTDMAWTSDHNAFYRRSTTTTPYLTVLANWPSGKLVSKTLLGSQQTSGQEMRSISVDNHTSDPYVLNAAVGDYRRPGGSPAQGRGLPLPADIAEVLGVPAGIPVDMGAL